MKKLDKEIQELSDLIITKLKKLDFNFEEANFKIIDSSNAISDDDKDNSISYEIYIPTQGYHDYKIIYSLIDDEPQLKRVICDDSAYDL